MNAINRLVNLAIYRDIKSPSIVVSVRMHVNDAVNVFHQINASKNI